MDDKPIENKTKPSRLANLRPPWKPGEAPKSPGRPPLPFDIKQERKKIQESIVKATPKAVSLLQRVLGSRNEKNAIRAAEILASHAVPKLDEGVITLEHSPLAELPDNRVAEILNGIVAGTAPGASHNGNGGNGAAA